MAVKGSLWSRDELISVIKLYCLTPFGRIHSRNPEIISVANILGRTPSSVALKMTNFASLDPTIARAGMGNHSKLDELVWNDFFKNMDSYLFDGVELVVASAVAEQAAEFVWESRPGLDVFRQTKTRVNQGFFRSLILTSYDGKCALTGIDVPELLVASHILPWSVDSTARTDPRNGICLNSLHDRAFDEGLMTFEPDYSVRYSPRLPATTRDALESFSQPKMKLPSRFLPDAKYLDYHRAERFIAS